MSTKKLILIISLLNLLWIKAPALSASEGVVINEVAWAGTAASANDEWIELYNDAQQPADLTGWKLAAADGQPEIDLGGTIAAHGYFLLERGGDDTVSDLPAGQIYTGSLSNEGEKLELKDAQGGIVDSLDCSAGWFAGDNLAKATMERIDPSLPGDKTDWATNNGAVVDGKDAQGGNIAGTPGQPNSVYGIAPDPSMPASSDPLTGGSGADQAAPPPATSSTTDTSINHGHSRDIVISEIFPNPQGSDTNGEFIELFNQSDGEADLNGWILEDASGKKFKLKDKFLAGGDYLVVYRPESQIALNNNKETLKLFAAGEDQPLQEIKYEKAPEGSSYNLDERHDYVWSVTVTPGAANIIKEANHKPQAEFNLPESLLAGRPYIFDSSDSSDPDGDVLAYFWDFGDGNHNRLPDPEHTFLNPGRYKVSLTVDDGKEKDSQEKIITVAGDRAVIVPLAEDDIILNEIFPDPQGKDEGNEFIELYNKGKAPVNLSNWEVRFDNKQTSKIKQSFWLPPQRFFLLIKPENKITLNNQAGLLEVFNPGGKLTDQVRYSGVKTGQAYARGHDDRWHWTEIVTPGQENVIILAAGEKVAAAPAKARAAVKRVAVKRAVRVPLEGVQELERGDAVKVAGLVAALPGQLGPQFFYLANLPGRLPAGLEIYSYKKDFPSLRIGDQVEVSGELGEVSGSLRLKTKDRRDIKVLEHQTSPAPAALTCDRIDEEAIGQLVRIAGEITSKKGSTVYLDDGTEEAAVYLKRSARINMASLKEGAEAEITGIISKTQSGLRLLPRSAEDVAIKAAEAESLPGEVSGASAWELPARDKKKELLEYLLVAAAGIILVLVVALTRLLKRNKI